jgi:hypothetical protein
LGAEKKLVVLELRGRACTDTKKAERDNDEARERTRRDGSNSVTKVLKKGKAGMVEWERRAAGCRC